MKALYVALAAAALAATLAAPVNAQSPFPGTKADIAIYADTVAGHGKVPLRGCAQYSNWPRGSRVVFRAWAVDTSTGEALGALDVKYAYVKIPGQPNLKLNWGPHGSVGSKVQFWSAGWTVPADYPLGVVAYKIVLKTNDGRFGTYMQPPITSAQLTVIP